VQFTAFVPVAGFTTGRTVFPIGFTAGHSGNNMVNGEFTVIEHFVAVLASV
jgi:hypothetical protein